jgi:uncharacterized membrane protein (DUF4010 family)
METASELTIAVRIAIAALIGLAVGLEREWSGHASGPKAQFAGIRTFFALGLIGGVAGVLCDEGFEIVGSVVAAAGVALAVAAYVMTTRRDKSDVDGTTEAAAIVVIALGVTAGVGWLSVAAGAGSVLVLALREKARLHSFVDKIGEQELRAALQFAALALVVLPLLPAGPFFGELKIEPRSLWTVVLIFSGLNYVGYLVRRAVGAELGYGIAGALGGLVSSTGVTLTFAQQSKREPGVAAALARGIVAACTVLPLRVLGVTMVLNQNVGLALLPLIGPVALAGGALTVLMRVRGKRLTTNAAMSPTSPLGLVSSIQMAVAFQVAMIALRFTHEWWGTTGTYASGAILGLADMDALTFSTTRSELAAVPGSAAAVIATGMVANNVMKAIIAIIVGTGEVRRRASFSLLVMAAVGGAMILLV